MSTIDMYLLAGTRLAVFFFSLTVGEDNVASSIVMNILKYNECRKKTKQAGAGCTSLCAHDPNKHSAKTRNTQSEAAAVN